MSSYCIIHLLSMYQQGTAPTMVLLHRDRYNGRHAIRASHLDASYFFVSVVGGYFTVITDHERVGLAMRMLTKIDCESKIVDARSIDKSRQLPLYFDQASSSSTTNYLTNYHGKNKNSHPDLDVLGSFAVSLGNLFPKYFGCFVY